MLIPENHNDLSKVVHCKTRKHVFYHKIMNKYMGAVCDHRATVCGGNWSSLHSSVLLLGIYCDLFFCDLCLN